MYLKLANDKMWTALYVLMDEITTCLVRTHGYSSTVWVTLCDMNEAIFNNKTWNCFIGCTSSCIYMLEGPLRKHFWGGWRKNMVGFQIELIPDFIKSQNPWGAILYQQIFKRWPF